MVLQVQQQEPDEFTRWMNDQSGQPQAPPRYKIKPDPLGVVTGGAMAQTLVPDDGKDEPDEFTAWQKSNGLHAAEAKGGEPLNETLAQMLDKVATYVGGMFERPDVKPENNSLMSALGAQVTGIPKLGATALRDPGEAWDTVNPVAQGGRMLNEAGRAGSAIAEGKWGEAGSHALSALNQGASAALTLVPNVKGAMAGAEAKAAAAPLSAKSVSKTLSTTVAAGQKIRPQAVEAIRKILVNSGVASDRVDLAIQRAADMFSQGQQTVSSLPATFAQLLERELAPDHPQVEDNVRLALRERGLSVKKDDKSPSTVRTTTQAMREEQTPFLKQSATENLGAGGRPDTRAQVATDLKQIGKEGYAPTVKQPADPARAKAIQDVINGPGLKELFTPLKQIAAAQGLDIEGMIAKSPIEAAHWMQHAALERATELIDAGKKTLGNAYNNIRTRILNTIDDLPVPGQEDKTYKDLREKYADTAKVDTAADMGNNFSSVVKNPEGAADFEAKFKALTPAQQKAALQSIGDWVHQVLNGAPEDAPARIGTLIQQGVVDALDRLGPEAQKLASDIRAVREQNKFLTDVTNRGQSATIPNAQAMKEGPKLYSSGPGSLGTVGTDAVGMATGAYNGPINTVLKGVGAVFDKIGRPLTKTREDMTRILMARQGSALRDGGEVVKGPGGGTPKARPSALQEPSGIEELKASGLTTKQAKAVEATAPPMRPRAEALATSALPEPSTGERPKFNTKTPVKEAPQALRDLYMKAPEGIPQSEWDAVRKGVGTGRLPGLYTLQNRIDAIRRMPAPSAADLRRLKALNAMRDALKNSGFDFE